jgi:hypothetical protein
LAFEPAWTHDTRSDRTGGDSLGRATHNVVFEAGHFIGLGNWNLIEAGNEERNRNRKPYKEGRVVGVVAAAVILAAVVPTTPVAGAVPSVGVVPLSPVAVVPVTPVIVAMVIRVAAGMNGGMTGMDGTSLRRSNSDDGYQDKAQ